MQAPNSPRGSGMPRSPTFERCRTLYCHQGIIEVVDIGSPNATPYSTASTATTVVPPSTFGTHTTSRETDSDAVFRPTSTSASNADPGTGGSIITTDSDLTPTPAPAPAVTQVKRKNTMVKSFMYRLRWGPDARLSKKRQGKPANTMS